MTNMVKKGEIDFRMLIFLVILHIINQLWLDFFCNRHNLKVFSQKISDFSPFVLGKMTDFCGKKAFVIETLRHCETVCNRFSHFHSIAFNRVTESMPEIQNMPEIMVIRVFFNHFLLKLHAKINIFWFNDRENI